MTVAELVTQWWQAVNDSIICEGARCCSNCNLQSSCSAPVKTAHEKQGDFRSEIAYRVGWAKRIFVISETECIVSYWAEDQSNHFLEICTLEKG